MKKSLLMMMLLAGSCAVFAQTDSTGMNTTTNTTTNTTLQSSNTYSAYSAPSNVQMYLYRDYPTYTNVTWTPFGNYWRAAYNNNGRYDLMYYATNGDHYTVTLPVISTWVPDDIISRVGTTYGANIYDVTTLKAANGNNVYQVRYLDNGEVKSVWLDDQGNTVTEYWRVDDMNANMNNNSNMNMNTNTNVNTNTDMNNVEKMKVKTEDGKTKTKIKTKDGKTTKTTTDNNL